MALSWNIKEQKSAKCPGSGKGKFWQRVCFDSCHSRLSSFK